MIGLPAAYTSKKGSPMTHEWLSQQQIASEFGISDRTVRRMIADGRLPAHRLGPRLVRIRRTDAQRLMAPIVSQAVPL